MFSAGTTTTSESGPTQSYADGVSYSSGRNIGAIVGGQSRLPPVFVLDCSEIRRSQA